MLGTSNRIEPRNVYDEYYSNFYIFTNKFTVIN